MLMIFISILIAFFLGCFLILMVGGKTGLHYLLVRAGKNKKLLLFVDTPTGRQTIVGKIEGDIKEGIVSWKYNGSQKFTELTSNPDKTIVHVGRFFGVNYIGLNVESPEKPYNLSDTGEIPIRSIDNKTLSNIIKRALTRPVVDTVVNWSMIAAIASILAILVGVFIFLKLGALGEAINALNIIT